MADTDGLRILVGDKLRSILPAEPPATIDVQNLRTLLSDAKRRGSSPLGLRAALRGSTLSFPSFRDEPVETAEQIERRKYLQNRADAREYERMTANLGSGSLFDRFNSSKGVAGVAKEVREASSSASVGLNMIMSMGTAFVIGYYVGDHLSRGNRVHAASMGTFFMVCMLLIEMVLYVARMRRVEMAISSAERSKRERTLAQDREHRDAVAKADKNGLNWEPKKTR
jgi:hypothetical protein